MSDTENFIAPYRKKVDIALLQALQEEGSLPMYSMLRYFMGYEDENGHRLTQAKGKRIRPVLLLVIADMFGGAKSAIDLAVAVELFHNFTLIHDDIEDNDELRRGRPTVWKLWGVDHGINSGDAQAFLTTKHLLRAGDTDTEYGAAAAQELNKHFLQVIEGQYLDFELTKETLESPAVTEEAYVEMIRCKTSVLIGTAIAAGGVAAGVDKEVRDLLFEYGENFGMAYQMADDMSSLWGDVQKTGKQAHGDIIEKKKTFPVIYARDHGIDTKLQEMYAKQGAMSVSQAETVVRLITDTGAREATKEKGQEYVARAQKAAQALPLKPEQQDILLDFLHRFIRFAPEQHASD